MIILGIDPGKKTGYDFYDTTRDRDLASGVMDGDDFVEIARVLREHRPDAIVVEAQFLGRKKNAKGETRYFANAFGKLRFYLYAWKVTAEKLKIKFEKPINPSTWQSHWKIKKGDKDGMVKLATMITRRVVDYNEADAILIARCWWAKRQAAERIGKAL